MEAVRSSLEVGFADWKLPERLLAFRGRTNRAIPLMDEFPFEDAQFDVVLMSADSVSRESIREAHRVLKSEGRLFFIVPEKTRRQEGFTLADIYSIVRDGFHIVALERPAWWFFRRTNRTLSITAKKKNWREAKWQSLRPSYLQH